MSLKITVRTVRDVDASPLEFDCYSAEQIKAWRNDEWHFVGVIVEVTYQGIVIGNASLWAIDSEDTAYHQEVAEELTREAVTDAETFLKGAVEAMKERQ